MNVKNLLVIWLVFMGLFLGGFALGRYTEPEQTPRPLQVTDKYEAEDGRCFVETWVEVSVEDYIGLDIGDEFNIDK